MKKLSVFLVGMSLMPSVAQAEMPDYGYSTSKVIPPQTAAQTQTVEIQIVQLPAELKSENEIAAKKIKGVVSVGVGSVFGYLNAKHLFEKPHSKLADEHYKKGMEAQRVTKTTLLASEQGRFTSGQFSDASRRLRKGGELEFIKIEGGQRVADRIDIPRGLKQKGEAARSRWLSNRLGEVSHLREVRLVRNPTPQAKLFSAKSFAASNRAARLSNLKHFGFLKPVALIGTAFSLVTLADGIDFLSEAQKEERANEIQSRSTRMSTKDFGEWASQNDVPVTVIQVQAGNSL